MSKIIRKWLGGGLPEQHYLGKHNNFILFFKIYVIHPVKRRVSKYYLVILKKLFGLKVIGITGSAGKTSTKEMLASVLRRKYKTVWSEANIDPVYNIPTTILKCTPFTKYLILEMGVEYPGEMDFYLWLAKPDIGIVTNIFPTHLLFFKDLEGVNKEKGKLVKSLGKDSVAVLNSNNKYTKNMAKATKAKVVWFGKSKDSESLNKEAVTKLAEYLKISKRNIQKGLGSYAKPKNRFNLFKHKSGAYIFDDSYNSNPEALISTLDIFMNKAGKNKKVVVLGDMLELGEEEALYHKKIANELGKKGITNIIGIGKLSKHFGGKSFDTWKQALPEVKKFLKPKTYILIKGSRSIGLDNIIDRL